MPADIEAVIDKTVELLQKELALKCVTTWHKINGLVPSDMPTISIGCDDERYEEYTQSYDKCTAGIKIYVSLDNKKLVVNDRRKNEQRLEYGERCIRQLAHSIRQCLIENHSLDGMAETSFAPRVEYVTADEHVDLHIAVISFDPEFYVPRKRPSNGPKVETIKMQIDLEGS